MYGHFSLAIIFSLLRIIVAGGFLYLIWDISKSLKRIANHLGEK